MQAQRRPSAVPVLGCHVPCTQLQRLDCSLLSWKQTEPGLCRQDVRGAPSDLCCREAACCYCITHVCMMKELAGLRRTAPTGSLGQAQLLLASTGKGLL